MFDGITHAHRMHGLSQSPSANVMVRQQVMHTVAHRNWFDGSYRGTAWNRADASSTFEPVALTKHRDVRILTKGRKYSPVRARSS